MSKRTELKVKNGRFCRIEVEIKDGRLSVCGTEGTVMTRQRGRKEALQYWVSYFEECPEAIQDMNKRFGKRFTSATGAAKFVLATDGEFHGLDILDDGNRDRDILITESCGQIRDSLADWFPEYSALLPWHLNDMKPGCEHQEALGWGKRPIDPAKPTSAYGKHFPGQRQDSWNMLAWVTRNEHPEGLLSHPCPTCGYKYGSAWLKRELPSEIVALAESVGGGPYNHERPVIQYGG